MSVEKPNQSHPLGICGNSRPKRTPVGAGFQMLAIFKRGTESWDLGITATPKRISSQNPSRRLERQRGVVQIDAQLARWIAEVAEGVLHLGLLAIGIREEITPLRECRGTLQEHAIVLEADGPR